MRGKGYRFGAFTLHSAAGPLLRDGAEVKLQPKTLVLLWTLMRQAGEVVSKAALFDAVWPRRVVVESALSFQIQLLRTALGDDPKSPRYVATVHRIGFRFIAPVTSDAERGSTVPTSHSLVGRVAPLERLQAAYARSWSGSRQLVFVTGDAGIGKTAVIERFVEHLTSSVEAPLLARGQSIEHYGDGEPYGPILEAITQLCRHDDSGRSLELLQQWAPAWVGEMSSLLGPRERAELQSRPAVGSSARQQRELCDALDALCATRPLVIVLEDLHWSDTASIELLTMLAQRQDAAQLLIVCSYRPVDAVARRHPVNHLKLGLAARRRCEELALAPLLERDAAAYLALRFPNTPALEQLAAAVHRHSGGLPLFMVQIAEVLPGLPVERFEAVIPNELRGLVGLQIERVSTDEQQALEAASVEGIEFTAACVAAVLGITEADAELQCDRLVRHGQFVEDRGLAVWPDGTASGRYAFRHALYQAVLYRRMSAGRRRQMHLRIAERLEAGFSGRERDSASELAAHFGAALDAPRAVRYYELAGDIALQRCAPQQAITLLGRAIERLAGLPDDAARTRQELTLQLRLGGALIDGRGYTAEEVRNAYQRASQLSQTLADLPARAASLWGLFLFHLIRAEFPPAHEIGEQLMQLALQMPDNAQANLQARLALGAVLFFSGEPKAALPHFEQGLVFCALDADASQLSRPARDLRVECMATASWLLWTLGDEERARLHCRQAVSLASGNGGTHSLDIALFRQSVLYRLLDDPGARRSAESLRDYACENGLVHWELAAKILLLADDAAHDASLIGALSQAIEARRQMGVGLGAVLDLMLLAQTHARLGQAEAGLCVVGEAQALVNAKGERLWEAELKLIEAELHLQRADAAARVRAEQCLRHAIAISRRQGALPCALRAQSRLNGIRDTVHE